MKNRKYKYHCKDCKFYTLKLSQFKIHLETTKHCKISDIKINEVKDFETFKIATFCCDSCNKTYMSNQSLKKHMKECKNETNTNKIIEKLTNALILKDEQLTDALKIAKKSTNTTDKTINILKYAKMNLNDADPLEEIKGENILNAIKYKNPKGTETKNETYVKIVIHKFNHGIFANLIGDMIIDYYKPKTKNEANVIATDTSRLCFIIMQKVKKDKVEKKEWINDKSGKKFTELVLNPIVNAVKQTLVEFIEFKKTKELNENNLCLMGKCVELKRDIEVEKFTKQILKYVAPSFHFDTLKLLDENLGDDSNDDSNNDDKKLFEDEKPIKYVTKKKKIV